MSLAVIIHEKGGQPRRQEFNKSEVTIGRVQGNDIILPKQNVSKRHSRIVVKDGKFIIVDLKSTNGTYVNGRKIASPMVIKETDKIYIGDFILSTEPLDAGAQASAAPPPVEEPRAKAPPPPPRRQPPPASPRPSAAPEASPAPRTRPPKPATPKPPAIAPKTPAPAAVTPPAAVPSRAPAPMAMAPAATAAPAPPPVISALNVSAEQAPQALYRWLVDYAEQSPIDVPDAFNPESSLDRSASDKLSEAAREALDGISGIDAEAVAERAVAEVMGAGPLTELLGDSSIERIYFNGPDHSWVTRGGQRSESGSAFSGVSAMVAGVRRLLGSRGLGVADDADFVSGYLADGTRVHMAMPSVGGPYITIDRPQKTAATLTDMISSGVMSENMATFLTQAMGLGRVIIVASNELDARLDLLAALINALPDDTRVVATETGGRLSCGPETVLLSRSTPDELIRNALKMRPDRLVVADAGGAGALTALTAMGGSVNGGIIGVDARAPEDAITRLAHQGSVDTRGDASNVRSLVCDRAEVLVQLLTYADGQYCVSQIVDVDGELNDIFTGFDGQGHTPRWYSHAQELEHPLDPSILQ
jgi:pilus assembly protein CpaF